MRKTYSYTVQTTVPSQFHVVPTEDFLERFKGMPDIIARLRTTIVDHGLDHSTADDAALPEVEAPAAEEEDVADVPTDVPTALAAILQGQRAMEDRLCKIERRLVLH